MSTEGALLPEAEMQALERTIARVCTRVRFCAMRDCGEEYLAPDPSGFHKLTWGLALDFADLDPICISWTQDKLGQPNRLAVVDAERVLSIDSAVVQDVSKLDPWSCLIGAGCSKVTPHAYASNYAREPSVGTWHPVLWGLEFHFRTQTFLVAAVCHEQFLTNPMVNDELVIAYTLPAVQSLIALRQSHREEWRTV